MNDEGILWWSHGGKLHGESPERFKFLQKIMEETPAPGLRPLENQWDEVGAAVDNSLQDIKYYIFYYSFMRPSFREYHIDDETEFEVEVIDTWNMTIEKKGFIVKIPNLPICMICRPGLKIILIIGLKGFFLLIMVIYSLIYIL